MIFSNKIKFPGVSFLLTLIVFSWLVIFLGTACDSTEAHGLPTKQATAVNPLPTTTHEMAVLTPTAFPPKPTAVLQPSSTPSTNTPPITATPFFADTDESLQYLAQNANVPFYHSDASNTGFWRFPQDLLHHPIDIELNRSHAFVLDSGRVLKLWRDKSNQMELLLSSEVHISGIPVLEPIDLTLTPVALFVLDRAGDVYRYDLITENWTVDWYGRYLEESSGHYYVALASDRQNRVLLDSSYHFVQRYGNNPRIWPLSEQLGVDIALQDGTYVLQQSLLSNEAALTRYQNAALDPSFTPTLPLIQARQMVVTENTVFVLDWGGRRLVQLDKTGQLIQLLQTPPGTQSFTVAPNGRLVFASSEGLYFPGQPENSTVFEFDDLLINNLQPPILELPPMGDWQLPIGGTQLTTRPLQMPGAPRHYRLGVHEGLDFYWRRGTPVYAPADGVVIRVVQTDERPSQRQFDNWRTASFDLGKTPDTALDFYRGNQVWVQHGGLVSRYAHLSQIAPEIEVGAPVSQGQVLGAIGNSGSPASVNSQSQDAHLHFELWVEDRYLGQYLRPVETWELINQLWDQEQTHLP